MYRMTLLIVGVLLVASGLILLSTSPSEADDGPIDQQDWTGWCPTCPPLPEASTPATPQSSPQVSEQAAAIPATVQRGNVLRAAAVGVKRLQVRKPHAKHWRKVLRVKFTRAGRWTVKVGHHTYRVRVVA